MSVAIADGSLEESIGWFRSMPAQHPLYYLVLHVWMLAGDSDTWVRLLSAVFGVAGLWCCFFLARELFDDGVAQICAVLLCFSPFYIYFGREARMYSMLATLAMVTSLVFWRYVKGSQRRWRWLYVALAIAGSYTHFFFVFLLISHFGYVALARPVDRAAIRQVLGPLSIVAVSFLPWMALILVSDMIDGQGWKGIEHVIFGIPYTFFRFVLGYAIIAPNFEWKAHVPTLVLQNLHILLPGAFITGVLFWTGVRRGKQRPESTRFVLTCLFGPFAIALALSVTVVILMGERYFTVSFPFFVLVLALGMARLVSDNVLPRIATWATVAGYAALVTVALYNLYFDATVGKEQWPDVARDLQATSMETDLVVLHAGYVEGPFRRYYRPPIGQRIVQSQHLHARERSAHDRVWLILAHASDAEQYLTSEWLGYAVTDCRLYPKQSGIQVLLIHRLSRDSSGIGERPTLPCAETRW